MLTIQKNDLFKIVTGAGFDPALFKVEDYERTTAIHVTSVPLVFEIMHSNGSFDDVTYRFKAFAPGWPYSIPARPKNYAQLTPARREVVDIDLKDGWRPAGAWCSFQEAARDFGRWLKDHVGPAVMNAAAPDLWADAAAALPSFDDVPADEVKAFSPAEQQQIRDALRLFSDMLQKTFTPDDEQLREIRRRVDYLSAAIERLNRFDWRALALSTVIGIGTSLSVDTQTGRELWSLFHQAMRTVGHLLSP